MNSGNKIPVISLCGLDGVGKTSIFNALYHRFPPGHIYFVGRGPADAERAVEKHFPRDGTCEEWTHGDFSHAIAIACAMDYLTYYDRTIGRVHRRGDELEPDYRAIVTDRHVSCFKAFAYANKDVCRIADQLLSSIDPPDYILYVEASEDIVSRRHGKPDSQLHQFERRESQNKLRSGYERYFGLYNGELIRVKNEGSFEEAVEKVGSIISEIVYAD